MLHLILLISLFGHHHRPKVQACQGAVVVDSSFTVDGVPSPYCRELDSMYLK